MFDEIRTYPEIDSTNLEAARLIRSGAITGSALLRADTQSSGRGSRGRAWESGAGNLMVSYVFPITDAWGDLQLAAYPLALGLQRFIAGLLDGTGCDVQVKWPNDLLVDGRKISGALHEIESRGVKRFFICGIGLNVSGHPALPETLFPAAHLGEFIAPPPLDNMAAQLGAHLETALNAWMRDGFHAVKTQLLPVFFRYGAEISVSLHSDRANPVTGTFEAITANGALCLRTENGVRELYTADIFPTIGHKPS